MNYKKGFTLIELLVVIAIISLLSSVVLASLRSSKDRGANASIKTNLNNMRSQAAVYYTDNNGSYVGVCSDGNFLKARTAVNAASGGSNTCNQNASAWALSSPLKVAESGNNYWCVDWSGSSKGHASALGSATTCP